MNNKTKRKVDFSEYKDKYDENFRKIMEDSPVDIETETMREQLYGYTYTKDYADGDIPEHLSMDYWREWVEERIFCDDPLETDLKVLDDIARESEIETMDGLDDKYDVDSVQEARLLEAIDSTGDGKTHETALCVIDVHKEYEYISRVLPYSLLELKKQSICDGIDCIEFMPNDYGIDCIYFDIKRRFEVGYPGIGNHKA